jgi:hypothetical protein
VQFRIISWIVLFGLTKESAAKIELNITNRRVWLTSLRLPPLPVTLSSFPFPLFPRSPVF